MYHYTNQPVYHTEVYQQCTLFDQVKNQNPQQIDGLTSFNPVPTTQNTSNASLDISNRIPCQPKVVKSKDKIANSSKSNVDTSNFTIEERLVAAVWVHERKRTKTTMSQIKHDFRQRFGRDPPAKNTLLVWERKLFSTGSVCDAPRPGRPVKRKSRVLEVCASVRAAPSLSLRARARALRLPRSTLRTILRADLTQPTSDRGDAAAASKGKESVKKKPKRQKAKKLQVVSQEAAAASAASFVPAPAPAPASAPAPACAYAPLAYGHSLAHHSNTQGYT